MGSGLTELLERVKAARGPSRDLDIELLRATRPSHFLFTYNKAALSLEWSDAGGVWKANFDGSNYWSSEPIPKFTTSLDAMVTLIEQDLPGATWMVRMKWAKVWLPARKPPGNDFDAEGATPALALCAAFLAALLTEPR